jgi:hypothetical protein
MRNFVSISVALGIAGVAYTGMQHLVRAERQQAQREEAFLDLLANPVGPAFLQAMAPEVFCDSDSGGAVSAIFAPGTPDWYIEKFMKHLGLSSGVLQYQLADRWGGFGFGDVPVNLTYSFPPDGTSTSGYVAEPSAMFARWDLAFGGSNGSNWKTYFRQAFDRWEQLTGNRYTEVPDDGASWPGSPGPFNGGSGRGDIRITSANIDGGGGVLAFNFYPDTGDMMMDSSDLVPTRFVDPANNYRYLRNVIMHEHGHGVGLAHVEPVSQTKLMEPFISTAFDGLQLDDRLGGQRTYGDTFEPNNSIGASNPSAETGIVVSNPNPQFLSNVSISNANDSDHYRVVTSAGSYEISATVAPISGTYLMGPQGGTASLYDVSQGVDLQLEIVDNLNTIMQSKNDNGLGGAETITGVQLANPGTYHIRVKRADGTTFNDIQGYGLAVQIESIGFSADISGNGCVDGGDLAILLAQWGPNPGAPSDLDGNGIVNGADLSLFLAFWAPCP